MNSVSDDDLRWLLALLEEENLAEIEVHDEGFEVVVRAAEVAELACQSTDGQAASSPLLPNHIPVLSPVAGMFYRASSLEAEPFVAVGDHVEHGDTVGLVEAMKLFNEVPSPVRGVVVRILVDNEQAVQEDQTLMIIAKRAEGEA